MNPGQISENSQQNVSLNQSSPLVIDKQWNLSYTNDDSIEKMEPPERIVASSRAACNTDFSSALRHAEKTYLNESHFPRKQATIFQRKAAALWWNIRISVKHAMKPWSELFHQVPMLCNYKAGRSRRPPQKIF